MATSWAVYDTLKTEHFDIIEISDYPLLFVPWVLERRNEPILIKLHGSLGQIEQFENRKGQQIQTSLLRFIEDRCISAAEGVMSYSRAKPTILGVPIEPENIPTPAIFSTVNK